MGTRTNPLTKDVLGMAAILCFESVAFTKRYFSEEHEVCKQLHDRKRRFESAKEAVIGGENQVSKLGLHLEDLKWALSQKRRVKQPDLWSRKFKSAQRVLKREMQTNL